MDLARASQAESLARSSYGQRACAMLRLAVFPFIILRTAVAAAFVQCPWFVLLGFFSDSLSFGSLGLDRSNDNDFDP